MAELKDGSRDALNRWTQAQAAVIGAMLLDQGLEFTHQFVWKLFEKPIQYGTILYEENPKSELQEAIQADTKETVVYKTLKEEGPSNNKIYTAGVYFMGSELGRGTGRRAAKGRGL